MANDVIKTLIAEAYAEGPEGMRRVAEVINNRARIEGKSPEQIVREAHQFTGLTSPGPKAKEAWSNPKAISAAQAAWQLAQGPDDPTGGADHYHADYVNPYWASSMPSTGQYGQHIFYSSRPVPSAPSAPTPRTPSAQTQAIRNASNMSAPDSLAFNPVNDQAVPSMNAGGYSGPAFNTSYPRNDRPNYASTTGAMPTTLAAFGAGAGVPAPSSGRTARLPPLPPSSGSAPSPVLSGHAAANAVQAPAALQAALRNKVTPYPATQSQALAIARSPGTTVASIPTASPPRPPTGGSSLSRDSVQQAQLGANHGTAVFGITPPSRRPAPTRLAATPAALPFAHGPGLTPGQVAVTGTDVQGNRPNLMFPLPPPRPSTPSVPGLPAAPAAQPYPVSQSTNMALRRTPGTTVATVPTAGAPAPYPMPRPSWLGAPVAPAPMVSPAVPPRPNRPNVAAPLNIMVQGAHTMFPVPMAGPAPAPIQWMSSGQYGGSVTGGTSSGEPGTKFDGGKRTTSENTTRNGRAR